MTTANSIDSDIPISVAQGGLGAVSFTDGAVLLGSGTGAVTALDVTAKGSLIVGDGTTDPVALAVGTNDHVLTADSTQASGTKWAAASGGSAGYVFISSATASTSASLTFSSSIDSTYNSYLFVFDLLIPATDAVDLYMRTSTDGGSTYDSGSTDYYTAGYYVGNAAKSWTVLNGAAMELVPNGQGNAAGETLTGELVLVNPSTTSYTKVYGTFEYIDSSANQYISRMTSQRKSSADVDAVQFLYSSGNIASGKISLYGQTKPS